MGFKSTLHLFLFCLFFLQTGFVRAVQPSEKKKIFYLNSYEITFQTYESSQRAINETFSPSNYIIDTDFMDSKRFYDEVMYDNLKERLRIKMKERGKYDMVLTSDDDALKFVMDNYQEFFTNTPVVFWGFDNIAKVGQLDSIDYITGVVETVPAKGNIELIRRIQPQIREVIAITDNTSVGIIDYAIYESLKKGYRDITLSELNTNDFTLKEFQDTISKMRNDQVILRLSSYRFKDVDLNLFEQIEQIYNNSPVPVYCWSAVEAKFGFFGGCLSDYYEQAAIACKMAKDVLNGADISKIKIIDNLPGKNMIKYQDLLKYHLPVSAVPEDVVLIGAPSKKLNIRKDVFFIIVFSLATTLILLIFNFRLTWIKRKLTNSLRISQQNYEILFRENPSINLLINPGTGEIEDANNTALHFYGYSIDEIKALNINAISTLPAIDMKEKMQQSKKGLNRNYISKHRRKNGELRDVEVFIDT